MGYTRHGEQAWVFIHVVSRESRELSQLRTRL